MSGDSSAPRGPRKMLGGPESPPTLETPKVTLSPGVEPATGPGPDEAGPRRGWDLYAPSEPVEEPGGHTRIWILGGVAAVVLLAYGGTAWAAAGRVPKGTTVAGVDVGGLSPAAAEGRLTKAAAAVTGGLPVTVGDRAATLDVAAAGLTLDAAATVDGLTGFSLDPRAVWRRLAGSGSTREAVPKGGSDSLDAALGALARTAGSPARDASVTFSGATSTVTPAVAGTTVDLSRAADRVRRSWLGGMRPIALPTTGIDPKVSQAAAEEAQQKLAKPALAGPLAIVVGSSTISLPPEKFSGTLSVRPDADGTLALAVDGTKLRDAVLAAAPALGVVPKDARIELQDGRPVVVPAVEGVTLDPAALAAAVPPALAAADRRATVRAAVEQPALTTAEAQALGVKERVSTFSTNLTADRLRSENLRVAARTVNGTLVMPGETFSLNGVLGQRTAAKGYNQAPAISGGRLVRDYGGGVSQMATTIFNNVFFAGLKDVYHKPHSFYISRYPEGREATVNWPTVDLKWKNDSPHAVLIQANVTSTVNVSFWSTKRYDVEATKSSRSNYRTPKTVYDDKPGCVVQSANPGFDVSVGRILKQDGRVVRRETFRASYIAEDKVVCDKKPEQGTNPPPPD